MVFGERRKVIIGLETAVNGGSISLFENGFEIDWIGGTEKVSKSEMVLERLDRLLIKNNIKRNEIEKICVSKGPGSLTGIRIGEATAFGIGNALQIDVLAVSIFDAMCFKRSLRGKFVTAFQSGESGIYIKAQPEKELLVHSLQKPTVPFSFSDFVNKMTGFVRAGGLSFILTENLAEVLEKHLADQTSFRDLKFIKLSGTIASFIARAGSSTNASDNV